MPNPYAYFALDLLHQHTTVVPHAQILTAPSKYVELAPKPGANRLCQIMHAMCYIQVSVPYTNVHADARMLLTVGEEEASVWGFLSNPLTDGNATFLQRLDSLIRQAKNAGNVTPVGMEGQMSGWGGPGFLLPEETVNKPIQLDVRNSPGNFTGGGAANTLTFTTLYTVYDLSLKQFI